jgi:large subunit ribosomal protein L1
MLRRSKRYRAAAEKQPQTPQPLDHAIKTLKSYGKTKFDQSVDIAIKLGIDAKQADQAVRGSVSLPKGIGKTKKVIAFCMEGDIAAAKAAGAIEAGGDELIDKVNKGWLDFDVAISHPALMGKVGRLGRVLGPQGKMPSPKSGTVTQDVPTAVKEFAAGKVEYRNDQFGNIHASVGKMSFPDGDLKENIQAFIDHIRRAKPAAAKGQYMQKVSISATMTPSVTLTLDAETHEEE